MTNAQPAPAYTEPPPKYIRAAYLAPGEAILRESRATRLYYLPAPIFWIIVVGLVEYAGAAAAWGWPAFPVLTGAFQRLTSYSFGGHSALYWTMLPLLGITVLLLLWLGYRYLLWMRTSYAVTTTRVIVQRGILSRHFDEIPVNKIRAIEVRQSAWQRVLGYGTMKLTSEGDSPLTNEEWVGMPKPWEFQKLADAAAQRYTQR